MQFEEHLLRELGPQCYLDYEQGASTQMLLESYDYLRKRISEILLAETFQNKSDNSQYELHKKINACFQHVLSNIVSDDDKSRMVRDKVSKVKDQICMALGCEIEPQRRDEYSTWQEWNPSSYLETFFSKLGPDTYETLQFISRELNSFKEKPVEKLLDFGCGPTVIVSLACEPYAKEIHLADYLPANLREVRKWLDVYPKAFNWNHCIRDILKIEGLENSHQSIDRRSNSLRKKAHTILCDASLEYPLLEQQGTYPIVVSIFCPDSATSEKETWRQYMRNIFNLVRPSGHFLVAALRKCKSYRVGSNTFPSANIDESDMERILTEDQHEKSNVKIEVCPTPECRNEGFDSVIFARSIKKS